MGAIIKLKEGNLDGVTVHCITRSVFAEYFSDFRLKKGELEGSCVKRRKDAKIIQNYCSANGIFALEN
jgi:hypothetical protein